MKKTKIEPILISSRESMMSHVTDIVRAKLKHAKLKAELELEKSKLDRKYQEDFDDLGREIATKEAGVQLFCQQHRKTEFVGKKSIDLTLAVVGFELTPASVEKVRSKDTWDEIAARMAGLRIERRDDAGNLELGPDNKPVLVFDGSDYVSYAEPALNKITIKADRALIPGEVFTTVGIRIVEDEIFYIRPKSEVAEATVQQAA